MTSSQDIAKLVEVVGGVVGDARRPVALHEPRFAGRERDYVNQCIDTGWVSSVGSFVDDFERGLAERCGAPFAIATVNGTAALHIALVLSGVTPGDEVIIPTLTFVATANAVSYCGAHPNFVDSEAETLGLDPHKLRDYLERTAERRDGGLYNRLTGRRLAAVTPVHVFGHPADLDGLTAVCADFDLPLIEDATESLGSTYRGRPCGGFGQSGVLSFNGNKIITTGGGGAIVTHDPALARRAKHLTTTAKTPHKWSFLHDETGWNYRLPNLNAAMGVAQLEQLDTILSAKRTLAQRYAAAFAPLESARFIAEPPRSRSNYWLNSILLTDDDMDTRDALLTATHAAGLLTRPVWTLMHRLPMFADCPRDDLSVAESIERRLVSLPSSAVLGMSAA